MMTKIKITDNSNHLLEEGFMLYQVYLVDDEKIALDDICNNVPWSIYGFEVQGKNTDPEAALSEIAHLCPHVVVSDLKMPVIHGHQLIESVLKRQPQTEFLVVSAYDDYQLIRKSFKLQIYDYLLKPISVAECGRVLENLHSHLGEKIPGADMAGEYSGSNKTFNAVLGYIGQNIHKRHSLQSISERFHVSGSTICQYFNKYLGTTFVEHLTQMRMENAKALLVTDKPIKEIALLCGYDNYFYFCKVFQRYFHCTPSEMRGQYEKTQS